MKPLKPSDKTVNTQPSSGNESATEVEQESPASSKGKSAIPIIALIVAILLIGGIAAGAYKGWEFFQQYDQAQKTTIDGLQSQLSITATQAQLDQRLKPLSRSVGQTDQKLGELKKRQDDLTRSTEKLFELYGRDENGWKLAEIEYLLSISQHKLVLENDFEGAAKTLDAASNRIAELADPGLLAVRVKISEEIAQLKTRVRPDLVGMTLLVSRLTQQIRSLTPGYQSQTQVAEKVKAAPAAPINSTDQPLDQRIKTFVTSLVTIKTTRPEAEKVIQTNVIDVKTTLEDQLKLTRWALLERDAFQYQKLMTDNTALFKEYFDLKNAANADFYDSLLSLQKSPIKPDLPDISGSLRMLKEIQKQRDIAPQQEVING